MYFLGIDIGSTSIKATVLKASAEGETVVGRANVDYPTYYPFDGAVEHSPSEWNYTTVAAVRNAIAPLSEDERKRICGISFSSQAGSIYPADENNRPLYNALTWMDRRATKESEDMIAALGYDNIRSKCGWRPAPTDCVAKLLWLKRNQPEIFAQAKHFYTTLESVTGFLCGNFVTDPTNIALSRLYDYKQGVYIPEALEFLGISEDMLPTVAPCGSLAGKLLPKTAEACGLEAGIPVYVGAHDQYCASLGSGVTEPGQLLIATGTAWVVFGVAEQPITVAPFPAPCAHPIPERFGVMTSLAGCGGALGAFAASVGSRPATLDREISAMGVAECRESIRDFFVCPLPPNPAIPHRDGVCGSIEADGVHEPFKIALAAMEGAVFEARALIEAFEEAGFPKGKQLIVSGGASKSSIWMNIVSAVFSDRPIYRLSEPDSPALGATMIAAVGSGAFEDLSEAARLVRHMPVEVDADSAEFYADKYRRYREWALK
ncbi:MAG: FGGY-family carbohydrate kinase [Clostridia bacterium]|nr:FGGY-family carbohydrate kinase [Clostridia bacterium]